MNKANECICPSGDGSLVHPCPAHPAVEQAGGDERAACNLWIAEQQLCQGSDISLFKLERNGALVSLHDLLRDAYQAGQARAALAQPSPDAPYADGIAADLERSDWTPEDALRWYAAGKHFDTVNGRTRIIDTGAVASNALKHLSLPYLEMKGDAELTELREAMAQPSPAPELELLRSALSHIIKTCGQSRTETRRLRWIAQRAQWALDGKPYDISAFDLPKYSATAKERLEREVKVLREYARGLPAPVAQAQHSVPDGASDLCRFLAKLYCELDGLRYSTAKLPAEQIADALIFKWPVLQGARNQLNIKRISEQPYDESKLHSAIAAMLAAAPGKEVPQAWLDVQAERRRQVEAEGWAPEHDDQHADGQMAVAAGYYALACGFPHERDIALGHVPQYWPWDARWWKPKDARSNLVRSCALALAEIERLDRACISQSPQPGAATASS
ncbi:hypothetical protein L4Q78_001714 [Pseudomonas aeruginosa]|uniref:hypothetical protein n=1 Tax=Pseudomonas aeruginosa TaxID=287 RepID=UPI0021E2B891|nr:hypothetical protein [Pseudomonas aeruginosa]EKU8669422.1 hypothetical protein [Pseudomonas aeruginosa]MCV0247831.1 hypothetical protein [Pseudomonas aeruginosa]